MPCKKENCKCFKCGKIADQEVDTKLLSNSSTSDLKPEFAASENEAKAISNVSSGSKSSFVVYRQEYPSKPISANSSINSDQPVKTAYAAAPVQRNLYEQSSIETTKSAPPPDKLNNSKDEKIEEKTAGQIYPPGKLRDKTQVVDKGSSPIKLDPLFPIPEAQKTKSDVYKSTDDFIIQPPFCSHDDLLIQPPFCSTNTQTPLAEDDEPVRKFSISMREDVDKPLHPLLHRDYNGDLPTTTNEIEDDWSSDGDSSRSPEKGYLKDMNELKTALQLIVDTTDTILNTFDKGASQSEISDNDDKKRKRKDKDSEKSNQPHIYNIHHIQLDSPNPVTINLPLQLNFSKNGSIKMNPMKPYEVKARSSVNNIPKTSSESVNIHYPKTPYKSLSSEFVITENVLVNGGIPKLEPLSDMEHLSDKVNLKLPVNFPQQRDIKVCVPCFCDRCPLFNDHGEIVCPEKCGCCTCAYTTNEANPEDRSELELCRCTSKTQFNTIGRSYVNRCQCSKRVDLCPCRDKYGSLGEQVAEFDDDNVRDIKKRKYSRKSSLRTSRISQPLLQFYDDSPNNENTTTTTPTTDGSGRKGDDEDDRGRNQTNRR